MRHLEVINLLKQQPFQPLRFHFSNGETRDLRHPESAIVQRSMIVLSEPNERVQGLAENVNIYSLIHIVKIEPLTDGQDQPVRESA